MIRSFKTEAIVLKKIHLLEKDNIITIFTEKNGKIKVFAKGIKKITSRRLPHVQTANLIRVIIYKKDNRLYLQETQLLSSFTEIKKKPDKLDFVYFILFILDRLLPENETESNIYKLTKKFLIEVSQSNKFDINRLTLYFNKILRLLGYIDKNQSYGNLLRLTEEIINEKLPSFSI